MPLPAWRIEDLIDGVFSGKYSLFDLPEWLYYYTAYNLDGSFFSGYGEIARGEIVAREKAVLYRKNLGRFSGAKTFQEIKDLTDVAFKKDGTKQPFAQYKEAALKIDNNYNTNWLRTEQDSVFIQAQNARKWVKFEEEKDVFPYLKYSTVADERVRQSHKDLDGIVAKVDDPIWNSIMPQNDWGCRCTVIQLHEATLTSKARKESKTAKVMQDFKKNPEFKYNVGKKDYIFKENGVGKASYFKVPREFKDDLEDNFGFPSIEEVTRRYL